MRKIVVVMLGIFLLVGTALAYDASTPWTGTVRWTIPSDTTFTVAFAASMDKVYFNATSLTQTNISAQGQVGPDDPTVANRNTSVLTITNAGNVKLNFTVDLTTARPSWVTWLRVCNISCNNSSFCKEFGTVAGSNVTLNDSIAIGDKTQLYMWTSIASATYGTTERTMNITTKST